MQERHPELLQRCSHMSDDKGYDDHKLINRLWQQHQIKPVIAIRNCWKDGEAEQDGVLTKLVSGQENVIYTHDGQVSCMCPQTGELHRMAYGGFEAGSRDAQVSLSGALLGDHLRRHGSVPGERRGAHPAGRGTAGVHAGGAVQPLMAGFLRPARCRGAGQQRVGRRLPARGTGHPRAGEDAAARHHGADDHAGDGLGGASAPANVRTCGVWSDPPDRRPLAGHHEKRNPTGYSARPVCLDLCIEPRMRLDAASRTPFSTLNTAVIRARRASAASTTSRTRAVWHDRPPNGPQSRYSAIASD